MAQKCNGEKKTLSSREKDILNENVPATGSTKGNQNEGCESESEAEKVPECAVCLQTCIHPVQLPCSHIFCFLCVKGVANQSKRCALCRQEIPMDFLNNPALLRRQDLLKNHGFDDGFQWFYEGRNGWWQYDERTSNELEDRLKRDIKAFEILIAGFLYVIDLDQMVQIRRNDPTRRRRIKRDLATIAKKGVAGLKMASEEGNNTEDGGGPEAGDGPTHDTTPAIRVGAEGDDMSRHNNSNDGGGGVGGGGGDSRGGGHRTGNNHTLSPGNVAPNNPAHQLHPAVNSGGVDHALLNTMSNLSVSLPTGGSPSHGSYGGSPHRSPNRGSSVPRDLSPSHNLNNTPQTPENTSAITPETPDSTTEEMNRNLEELALTPSGRYRHLHRHGRRRHRNRNRSRHYDEYGRPRLHLLETSSSSSDSDWDYWY